MVEVYRGRYNVLLGMTVVGPKLGMANMASVDARPSTPLHPCRWGKVPSEPGQKMLRIERQEGRGSTTMRQGSQSLGRSLTLETLDDESGVSSFGLGGPDEARRGGQGFGRRHGKARDDGRITKWLGAFLVTIDQRSLRDRTPALVRPPVKSLSDEGQPGLSNHHREARMPADLGVWMLHGPPQRGGPGRQLKFEMVIPMVSILSIGWQAPVSARNSPPPIATVDMNSVIGAYGIRFS